MSITQNDIKPTINFVRIIFFLRLTPTFIMFGVMRWSCFKVESDFQMFERTFLYCNKIQIFETLKIMHMDWKF